MESENSINVSVCSQCKTLKHSCFFKRDKNVCTGCLKKNQKKVLLRTKDGILSKIYSAQKRNSISRNHDSPDYSLNELKIWAFNQLIFHQLYDIWVASNYESNLTPSFDRTDNSLGYCLTRLQIMTWQENRAKG